MARQRGFILLYVVAMVAALTIILMQVQQRTASIPGQTERELGHALQWQEGRMLLDFVIAGTVEQKLGVDPRFVQFRRLLAEDPARQSELEEALLLLKAMLDQLGFNIDVSRGKGGMGLATKRDDEGVMFLPRHEDYTLKLGERQYRVRVLPGNTMPNLNTLGYEPMWRYLQFLGLPLGEAKDLAANLVDWRDPDIFLTDNRGAEQEYYLSLSEPYSPRNAAVRHWQELAYVKGVTPQRLQLLRENFFLGSALQRGVLGNYAKSDAVMALSGLRAETVKALLRAYGAYEGKAGTTTDVTEMPFSDDDIATFDATVTMRPNHDLLRIQISSDNITLHVDYDVKTRREISRW
jgi:type II secretory pathway component PulK